MNKGFSIVICSYNPDKIIFQRLITAVKALSLPLRNNVEYIFIDNNSSTPLSENPDLKNFLELSGNSKCVIEKKQGLTEARIRGFKEAQNEWIIFFDDDNEPNKEYLVNLEETITKHPEVFCWGPAEIKVELQNVHKNAWIQSKRFHFQERNWEKTSFGTDSIWQAYFPYGTGLVVHKSVLVEYIKRIENGQYSLSDRKGKSLSSGGDLQIVLTATNMGLSVGTIKGLSVNHLIVPQKTTVSYLERQIYGTSSSYVAAHKQANPTLDLDEHLVTNREILKKIFTIIRVNIFRTRFKDFRLRLAALFGSMNARFVYRKAEKKPFLLKAYEKLINE